MTNMRLATDTRNKTCDGCVDDIDAGAGAGTIKIYTTAQPASANTAVGAQTLLATLTFSDPAFGAATGGVATASAITSDTSADATGTAVWARIADSDGNTVFDCDVGTTGTTIVLNSVSITSGGTVACTAFTVTVPSGE